MIVFLLFNGYLILQRQRLCGMVYVDWLLIHIMNLIISDHLISKFCPIYISDLIFEGPIIQDWSVSAVLSSRLVLIKFYPWAILCGSVQDHVTWDKNYFYLLHAHRLVLPISDRTETEYVSQMLTKIKRFAQHHACHVWFVAHPRQVTWT